MLWRCRRGAACRLSAEDNAAPPLPPLYCAGQLPLPPPTVEESQPPPLLRASYCNGQPLAATGGNVINDNAEYVEPGASMPILPFFFEKKRLREK